MTMQVISIRFLKFWTKIKPIRNLPFNYNPSTISEYFSKISCLFLHKVIFKSSMYTLNNSRHEDNAIKVYTSTDIIPLYSKSYNYNKAAKWTGINVLKVYLINTFWYITFFNF